MRHRLLPALALFAFVPLLAGCAPDGRAAMHVTGQIGRFYGDGISFSVPLVRAAEKPGEPEQYWEVRQGIESTLVVAFSPLSGKGDGFRENVVVTSEAVPEGTTASAFRDAQVQNLVQEGSVEGRPRVGEDGAGPWAEYGRTEKGELVRSLAWFFVRPAEGDRSARGYVLVGSAEAGPEAEAYLERFRAIAATVRFGPPPSGFELLGQAVDAVALAAAGPAEARRP